MSNKNIKNCLVFILLLLNTAVFAQNGRATQRIHTLKIAFISDRLQLSTNQAEHFWPIYNNYEADLKDIKQHYKSENNESNHLLTDEEARRQLDNNLDLQASVLDLRKKYKNEFLKVISPSQLVDLFNAEKDFRLLLLKELQNRRERNSNALPMNGRGRRMFRY